jgi:hypothetical protein
MMSIRRPKISLAITRLAAAGIAFASMGIAVPAQAQGLWDLGRVILGIPGEEKPPIDYRERAPLVVPPNTNLRPPAEGVAPDQRRANWPQDPDVVARRRAAEDARRPVMVDSVTGREIPGARRLTPDEIRAGRVAGGEVTAVPSNPKWNDADTHNVMGGLRTLREMDARSTQSDGQLNRAEPRRAFLTDPPTGVRRPADNAPFRASREGDLGTRKEPHPLDIFRESPNTR